MVATRPAGVIGIADVTIRPNGDVALTVIDTRAEDPGWSLTMEGAGSWRQELDGRPVSFTDSSGLSYTQEIERGSAIAGHGLGLAHLVATFAGGPDDVLTVTVI